MENMDLSTLSTPQLRKIRNILLAGVPAVAESEVVAQEYLCHKNPPKGYPKERTQYGDSSCYRYPLDTKSRCLAAWRYVHHANNRKILSDKFKSVESKIKGYAKEHYDLDLQVGESEDFDWEQAFLEHYDAETMGERCENIILEEPEGASREVTNMDEKERIEVLEAEIVTLKGEKEAWATEKTELEGKASQVDAFTEELNTLKQEVEDLRTYKKTNEEAAERAERLKSIKAQLEEAELEVNLEDEVETSYWLDMSEEVLKKTIAKMGEIKKGQAASASMKVPQITGDESTAVDTVRKGLREWKEGKK